MCFSHAQILENKRGEAFTNTPFFNTVFIQKNRIKSLKGFYVIKKRNELLKITDFEHVYNFDSLGLLSSTYETNENDGTKKINWNKYSYDSLGRIINHAVTEKEGLKGIEYTYDSLGRIIKETHYRIFDTTNTQTRKLFMNHESWKYSTTDSTKRTKCNSYDLPYLIETVTYDKDGYLLKKEELLKMTSKRYVYQYSYDDHGLLSSIKKMQVGVEIPLERVKFRYDSTGNIVEKHLYKNGKFITDYQFIYNSKTQLLATIITKNVATGHLSIIRFKDYEYYPN